MTSTITRSHVVVIGGGVGGVFTAKKLIKSKAVNVTLISPQEYFEWGPGNIRSMVKPAEASKSISPSLLECVKGINFVQGRAIGVGGGAVKVSTGAVIKYDVLVIATGGRYDHGSTMFLKSPENATTTKGRIAEVQGKSEELAAAKSVTIVGAGATGVELACEIATDYPAKKVNLVSRKEIAGQFHPKVQTQIKKRLAQLHVNVVLHTSVSPGEEGELKADKVYYTTGFTPNTEFLQGGELEKALDRGMIKVDRSTLLVEGQTNVFAIGDIITPGLMEAPFMSGYVTQQESVKLAQNVILAANGKQLKPMGKAAMKRGAMLSLGKGYGTGHFDNMVLPQCMVAMMKSKDLFRAKVISQALK